MTRVFRLGVRERLRVHQPGADVAKGLGQLDLKPEELRGLICASRSFLEDIAINIENWLVQKGQQGVRRIASRAIAVGTGVGMPMGILNPAAAIPICDTAAPTPAGQFTWQVAMAVKNVKSPERRQNPVALLNSAIVGCGFELTPVQQDHDTMRQQGRQC